MKEYDVEPLRRRNKILDRGARVINSFKDVVKAPFKFAGSVVENVAAPIVMTPYQVATDAIVGDKVKKPIEYKHDIEFAGLNVPVSHKLDASKSSIDRGFSLKNGFTTDYNVVLDHEIRLGKATPIDRNLIARSKPTGTGLHPLNK